MSEDLPPVEPKTYFDAPDARESILTDYAPPRQRPRDRYWLHILLFLATVACTVFYGAIFVGRFVAYGLPAEASVMQMLTNPGFLLDGLRFSLSLLGFLTVHEFGHYFAARYHRIDTSLPYYIPVPIPSIGTLGAVIRIREPIPTTRKLFDIGASGPLAGFVVALGVLLYAMVTLPPPSYLYGVPGHEALKDFIAEFGRFPGALLAEADAPAGSTIVFGNTLLYWGLAQLFPNVPPMHEMYHYPVLLGGWFGLFFTALNLLPIGQLDGGHILYALVGPKWHSRLAHLFVMLLLLSGGIGFRYEMYPSLVPPGSWLQGAAWFVLAGVLYVYLRRVFKGDHKRIAPALLGLMLAIVLAGVIGPAALQFGYSGWLIFGLLVVFLIRVEHPPVLVQQPLTPGRRALGILSLIIFVLCFSIRPVYVL